MSVRPSVASAEARVAAARQQLGDTLSELQARLDPRTVARNAIDDIAEGGEKALRSSADAVRRHPGRAAGALAIAATLLGRRRIGALIASLRNTTDEGDPSDAAAQPAPTRRVRFARPKPAPARRK